MKKAVLLTAILALAASGPALASDDLDVAEPYLIPSSRVAPDYPPSAYKARFGGVVTMHVVVDEAGAVSDIEVLGSTTPMMGFEDAAVEAARQWRFEPPTVDGQPVVSATTVTIGFRAPTGRNIDGYISTEFAPGIGGFGGGTETSPPGGATKEGGTEGQTPAATAFQLTRFNKPSLPPKCVGCTYDRRALLPGPPAQSINQPM